MIIGDDIRPGADFSFSSKATVRAFATFVAIRDGQLHGTRRAADLFDLPDNTPVIAHWHGQYRTDGFALTVGELRSKATA